MLRSPVIMAAALALLLAVALAVGAVLLPARGAAGRQEQQDRVETAVARIAERQATLHAESGAFTPVTPADVEADRRFLDLPWRSFPTAEYQFEAQVLDSGNLRIRAAPRPGSVERLDVAAQYYVAEVAPDGAIVDSGWLPGE